MTQETSLALPDSNHMRQQLAGITRFQGVVKEILIQDADYGVIPGTGTKPTLFKPGAEKVIKALNTCPEYTIDSQVDFKADPPFFCYDVRCDLIAVGTGVKVASGVGNCNSMEGKYRWRNAQKKCPLCGLEAVIKGKAEFGGGWLCWKQKGGCGEKWPDGAAVIEDQPVGKVLNEDTASLANTILKIAKKRAMVDATLGFAVLSDIFSQDLEDLAENGVVVEAAPAKEEPLPPMCEWHNVVMTLKGRTGPYHGWQGLFCNGSELRSQTGEVMERRPVEGGTETPQDAPETVGADITGNEVTQTTEEAWEALESASQGDLTSVH